MPSGIYKRLKFTKEHIRNMSKSNARYWLGKKMQPFTKEHKHKISIAMKGIMHSKESRKKISGSNSHLWRGGVTPMNKLVRCSVEYKLWRRAVFQRDNFMCVWCKARYKKGQPVIIQADHIKPFALYPELRFAIDNGRTLCIECHKKTDTYAGKGSQKEPKETSRVSPELDAKV